MNEITVIKGEQAPARITFTKMTGPVEIPIQPCKYPFSLATMSPLTNHLFFLKLKNHEKVTEKKKNLVEFYQVFPALDAVLFINFTWNWVKIPTFLGCRAWARHLARMVNILLKRYVDRLDQSLFLCIFHRLIVIGRLHLHQQYFINTGKCSHFNHKTQQMY